MANKPTYEELEQRVKELESESFERKKAEVMLREGEEHHRSFMESAKGFVVYRLKVDPDNYFGGRLVFVSPGIEDEIGVSPETEFNEWFNSVHPDDLPRLLEAHAKSIRNGDLFDQEFRWKNLEGEWGWCHTISNPVFDSEGNPEYFNGMMINVTAQKQAVKALQESEEKYRSLIANIPDVTWTTDSEGKTIFSSPNVEDEFGYTPEEIYEGGNNVFPERIHPEDAGKVKEAFEKLFEHGTMFDVEYRIKRKDGGWIWAYDRSIAVYERDGVKYADGIFSNITNRKQAEEALRESEAFIKAVLDNLPIGIAVNSVDPSVKFEYMNDNFPKCYRTSRAALADPDAFWNAVYEDPEFREVMKNRVLADCAGGDSERMYWADVPITRRGAETSHITARNTLVSNKQLMISTVWDVTERKRAEEALRKSEKRMKGIFESIPSPIIVYNTEGHPLYLNPAFTALFHWSLDELKGRRIQFVPDDQKELTARKIGEVYKTGRVVRYETKRLTKQGDVLDVIVSGAFVTGPDEKPMEMVAILTDITALKQVEEALRESEEKYRTVLESNPDPVVVYDMAGRVIYLNPAFTRIFGWSLEERIGKKMDGFVPEENMPETMEMIKKVTVSREGFSGIETRRYTKNGGILDISISGSSYRDHEGNVAASVINLRDITEQKRLEDQLKHSQKMEAIGTLAGGVAHDLNNILGGLVSYPELLLFQLPEDSPLRKSILTIQKSGEKAAAVVQGLLTLARRGVVTSEVVNLNDVVSDYLESPEHENLQSYHPGVYIDAHLEKDTLNILGSSTHLSKTVMNLISNAAEAMPEGGALTVSTENRYIDRPIKGYDDVLEGDYVILTVSDTGTGIAPDDLEKIFEPFYTKKKMGRSGTGLGMAVVWGTVKDHKGYIHVQSTEGKGTTFKLYFPVTRKSIEEISEISLKDYMGKGETILVVDDVEEQRNIASGMLKELGYLVASVSSGEEAVEYLKSQEVDLLVLDMIMDPGLDGLDTYKKILETHPGQKAIIASGFSETDRVKELQSLGAGAYIRKPFLLGKVGIAVKKELER